MEQGCDCRINERPASERLLSKSASKLWTKSRKQRVALFVRTRYRFSNTPSTYPATTPGKRKDLPRRSSSNGGFGLLVRPPSPRQQVGDYIGGVIWKLSSTSASQACGSTSSSCRFRSGYRQQRRDGHQRPIQRRSNFFSRQPHRVVDRLCGIIP
jgi:hypothetical protein